jgi:ubiquinone/menaquinone biosynthesis C-methylase UbiE
MGREQIVALVALEVAWIGPCLSEFHAALGRCGGGTELDSRRVLGPEARRLVGSMTDKQLKVFFEVHDNLPREGPGSSQSTLKALSRIGKGPQPPRILDVGCGPGAQTLCLAEVAGGEVFAVDNHASFLDSLKRVVVQKGLSEFIHPTLADMSKLPFGLAFFDMIWAEGSLYIIGVEMGLKLWRPLLKEKGTIAFTEVSWLRADIPDELKKFWIAAYPGIGSIEQNIRHIENAGYRLVSHFTLPESDWWNEYYVPIQQKLPALQKKFSNDPEALEVLTNEEHEIELYRRYSAYYGYVFYIAQKQ